MAIPAVELSHVTKRFSAVTAVDGVSVNLQQGEVVALLGPNGAGKTTTIDLVLGLTRPSAGTVKVFGRAPADAVLAGDVSAVLQTGGLLADLTVAETVRYLASLHRDPRPAAEVLARAGLTAIADRKVGKCSGGERQRLRFAIALLPEPRLLILDEPTAGMDVEGRRDFWAAIRADAARGRTVLFATHYLDEADGYADRIVLLRDGAVVADGTTGSVKNLAAGRTVRATLPGARPEQLSALSGVDGVELRGDTVLVHTTDSDAVARHLLTTTAARDVEITARNLEAAFLALTTEVPA
jgi:ABC-2 type transport system ATP-binding protein